MDTPRRLAIEAKYIGATSTNGSRVKLSLPNFKKSRTFAYNYHTGNPERQSLDTLSEAGIAVLARAAYGERDLFIVAWPDRFDGSSLARFFRIS